MASFAPQYHHRCVKEKATLCLPHLSRHLFAAPPEAVVSCPDALILHFTCQALDAMMFQHHSYP
jgi:hypothetical protein